MPGGAGLEHRGRLSSPRRIAPGGSRSKESAMNVTTRTYTTDRARVTRPDDGGLPNKLRDELEMFFCAYEGQIGIQSPMGSVCDRIAVSRAAHEESERRRRVAERSRKRALAKRKSPRGPSKTRITQADLLAVLGVPAASVEPEENAPREDPILTIADLVTAWPTSKSVPHVSAADVEHRAVMLVDGCATKRASRIRHALLQIGPYHRDALYLMCGPRSSCAEYKAEFGELAPLAELSETVEAAREALACDEGLVREAAVEAGLDAGDDALAELAETFWDAVGEERAERAKVAELRRGLEKAAECPRADVHEQIADGWRKVQANALASYTVRVSMDDSGRLSARLSALASADYELTAADALRHKLTSQPSPGADKVQREAHAEARKAFVRDVHRDIRNIWRRASEAYAAARGGWT